MNGGPTWLRDRLWWILALVLGVFGVAWLAHRARLGRVSDPERAMQLRARILDLRRRRAELDCQAEKRTEEISEIDRTLAANKAEIVRLHARGDRVPDDQLEAEFRRLGY